MSHFATDTDMKRRQLLFTVILCWGFVGKLMHEYSMVLSKVVEQIVIQWAAVAQLVIQWVTPRLPWLQTVSWFPNLGWDSNHYVSWPNADSSDFVA